MKILFITQFYNPIKGGAARRASRFGEYFRKTKHQLTVLTGTPSYPLGILPKKYRWRLWANEKEGKNSILRTYEYPAPAKGTIKRLINWISFMISASIAVCTLPRHDAVIVNCPTFLSGVAGLIAKKLWKCDFYYDVSDLWPDSAIDLGLIKKGMLANLAEKLEQKYYQSAKKVFVATPAIKRHLLFEKIPEEKVKLLLNSTDMNLFKPRKIAQEKFGFKKDDFVCLYVGNHSRIYDLKTIVKAAKILAKYPRLKFVFIGEGEEKENLIKLSQDFKLENVKFLPEKTLEEIADYLNISAIAIISIAKIKVSQEAMPAKTAEYLGAGVPIIASLGSDLKKYLIDNEAGLIYPPGNPPAAAKVILKLYQNPRLREKMGRNARKLALKLFSNDTLSKTLDETFK